jgi:hypothetical protein
MLQVISHNLGDRQGIVIIASDSMEEVMGTEAKQLALKTASANGISRPGISGTATPYPVDENGETSDDLVMGKGTVAGYRADFPVTGSI